MAGDLRLVAALLHLVKHLERIGDQCTNIAKMVPLLGHEPPTRLRDRRSGSRRWARRRARRCARRVNRSRCAIPSWRSTSRARTTCWTRLNREIFRRAIDIGGDDADLREWAMSMMLVARALERIGDNAVDIGEQTVFVVTGLFRELGEERAR